MTIAHQSTHFVATKLVSRSSFGWIAGYAVLAAIAVAASIYLVLHGQGPADLDPSQIVGP